MSSLFVPFRCVADMFQPNTNLEWDVRSFGVTAEEAREDVLSQLRLMGGGYRSLYLCTLFTPAIIQPPPPYANVQVILDRPGSAGKGRVVQLYQVSTSFITPVAQKLDVNNSLVQAFQTNFRDEDGQGGYVIYDSKTF